MNTRKQNKRKFNIIFIVCIGYVILVGKVIKFSICGKLTTH